MTDEKVVFTIDEAAKKLGISKESAYAAAQAGQIPTIRIGRLLRVPAVQLERMLAGEVV